MLVAKETERVARRSSWCYEGVSGGSLMGGMGEGEGTSLLRARA